MLSDEISDGSSPSFPAVCSLANVLPDGSAYLASRTPPRFFSLEFLVVKLLLDSLLTPIRSRFLHNSSAASLLSAYAFPGGDCIEPCISEMQIVMDSTPLSRNDQFGQLSWSQLLQARCAMNMVLTYADIKFFFVYTRAHMSSCAGN
ncbi:unnamed protein product [Toxocara canis]|uniref:Uncharacterized protein n=1 Tax=Toxocara canis TaxID=6265 RepID=A0A183V510_TOXCA|nr:unnamed protein product [Toxocara canis]